MSASGASTGRKSENGAWKVDHNLMTTTVVPLSFDFLKKVASTDFHQAYVRYRPESFPACVVHFPGGEFVIGKLGKITGLFCNCDRVEADVGMTLCYYDRAKAEAEMTSFIQTLVAHGLCEVDTFARRVWVSHDEIERKQDALVARRLACETGTLEFRRMIDADIVIERKARSKHRREVANEQKFLEARIRERILPGETSQEQQPQPRPSDARARTRKTKRKKSAVGPENDPLGTGAPRAKRMRDT